LCTLNFDSEAPYKTHTQGLPSLHNSCVPTGSHVAWHCLYSAGFVAVILSDRCAVQLTSVPCIIQLCSSIFLDIFITLYPPLRKIQKLYELRVMWNHVSWGAAVHEQMWNTWKATINVDHNKRFLTNWTGSGSCPVVAASCQGKQH
jgi:hypothetical protein